MGRSIVTIDDLANDEIENVFALADEFLHRLSAPVPSKTKVLSVIAVCPPPVSIPKEVAVVPVIAEPTASSVSMSAAPCSCGRTSSCSEWL